jgi:peptide/nickel transport system permease protein
MQSTWLILRTGRALISFLILTVVIFLCVRLLPGDAAVAILGENATPGNLAILRGRLKLDQPVVYQFVYWALSAIRGDMGISTTLNRPVSSLILPGFSTSLLLASISLLSAIAIALPLGVWSALRQGQRADAAILTISYIGVSVPDFVVGPLLIMLLASPPLGIFPSSGFVPFSQSPVNSIYYLFLPCLALVISLLARLVRQTRSGILNVLNADFVRTARLKGMPESVVLIRHVLPSALTATIVVIALDFGFLLGGVVIIEEIFAIPGLGRLMIYAVSNRDLPLVQMGALTIGLVYIVATLAADVVQYLFNPRIKRHG